MSGVIQEQMVFKAREWEKHQGKSSVNRSPSEGLNYMEHAHWVLDEFHFFRPGVCGTLRDVSRGLRTPDILSKTLLKCSFLLGQKLAFIKFSKGSQSKKGLKLIMFQQVFYKSMILRT